MTSPATPAATEAVAALATRGNTLFLMYTPTPNSIGTLFTLSPTSSGGSGGNGNKSAMVGIPQTIDFTDPLPVSPSQIITSASMVSAVILDRTSGAPYTHQYHLYLALNTPTRPYLVRLAPQSPNVGDGQDVSNGGSKSSRWNLIDQSQTLDVQPGIARAWLSSAAASGSTATPGVPPLEGSAIFEMLTSGDVATIQKLDVTDQPLGVPMKPTWPLTLKFLNNNAEPKIVRLTNDNYSGKSYEAFMIGACRTVSGTCILLIDSAGNYTSITTTNMMFDPTSCITAANGLVIMASTSGVYTFPYAGTGTTWTSRQPPSFAPNPSSSILACATLNSKLYAVVQGNSAGVPQILSIDLTNPNQWDWQREQLITPTGSNLTNVPPPPSGRDGSSVGTSKNGLSSGAVAAIVVIAILALLVGGFVFLRHQKRNQKKALGLMEKGIPPAPGSGPTTLTVSPPPLSPAATSSSYPSVYSVPAAAPVVNPMMPPANHEVRPTTHAQRGPMPQVARDWSNGSMISNTSLPLQQHQQPYVHSVHPSNQGAPPLESTTITSIGMPSMYAPTSPTMTSALRTHIMAGDKQELDNDDMASHSTPTPTSATFLQPTSAAPSPVPTSSAGNSPDPRLQGMLSPTLVNAQLILQQSQTPPNRRHGGNYR